MFFPETVVLGNGTRFRRLQKLAPKRRNHTQLALSLPQGRKPWE